ncbi:hypothetical protein [Nocardioides sp. MH1]|uniref:hypothetical protein n=1 Tax=Nocardioides sp. MH1 TaxID=3242490 RepID=UPI00352260DF
MTVVRLQDIDSTCIAAAPLDKAVVFEAKTANVPHELEPDPGPENLQVFRVAAAVSSLEARLVEGAPSGRVYLVVRGSAADGATLDSIVDNLA